MENRYSHLTIKIILLFIVLGAGSYSLGIPSAQAGYLFQQPTVSIPTVTGTPTGPTATVNRDQDIVYVHTGPGRDYPVIGLLVMGQKVVVYGVDRGGEWLQVMYMGVPGNNGWVYKSLMSVSADDLPAVESPPMPAPKATPTLDPTVAARYGVNLPPTQLPTFTPPAPVQVPTFAPNTVSSPVEKLPMGFVIIGLAVVGLFGTMLTLLRGR